MLARWGGDGYFGLLLVFGPDDLRIAEFLEGARGKNLRDRFTASEALELRRHEPREMDAKVRYWLRKCDFSSKHWVSASLGRLGAPGRDVIVQLLARAREGQPADRGARGAIVNCGIYVLQGFDDPRRHSFSLASFGDTVWDSTYGLAQLGAADARFFPWPHLSRAHHLTKWTNGWSTNTGRLDWVDSQGKPIPRPERAPGP